MVILGGVGVSYERGAPLRTAGASGRGAAGGRDLPRDLPLRRPPQRRLVTPQLCLTRCIN